MVMSLLEYELELEIEAFAPVTALPVSVPALQQVGLTAARAALARGLSTIPPLAEYEYESEWEYESEAEAEGFVNPIRRVYPDAMMEHFGHAAATARSEAEAEAFIGALIPLATRIIPRVAPMVMRAAPGLLRGVASVTRTLRRNPATRPLVRTVPTIVRRTVADINRQSAGGRRQVSPQQAVQTLARQTQRVLCSPQQAQAALRRNAAIDRSYHQTARRCHGCLGE
jgi:hypothetical protein